MSDNTPNLATAERKFWRLKPHERLARLRAEREDRNRECDPENFHVRIEDHDGADIDDAIASDDARHRR
jgi:hypothetical protein